MKSFDFWPPNRVLARISALLGRKGRCGQQSPRLAKSKASKMRRNRPSVCQNAVSWPKSGDFHARGSLAGEFRLRGRPCVSEKKAVRERRGGRIRTRRGPRAIEGHVGLWVDEGVGSIRTERGWMRARRAGPVSGRRRRTVCEHGLRAGRSQVARRGLASSRSRGARERKAHANGA